MKVTDRKIMRGSITTVASVAMFMAIIFLPGTVGASTVATGPAPAPSATEASEGANAQALSAPSSVQSPALAGPVASAFTTGSTIGVLTTTSSGAQSGVSGSGTVTQPLTITGTGLAANAKVSIDWSTWNATWVTDVEPQTANYLGTATTSFNVVLGSATTSATGALSFTTTVPSDFGGVHNLYAVVNGVEVADGGFTLLRTFTVSPKRGPIGTPITVTLTGLGESAYTTGDGVNWDNKTTGLVTALWTRGDATFTLRAAGPVGQHTIETASSLSTAYLNPSQSPVPYAGILTALFTTTRGNGPVAETAVLPTAFNATPSQFTTLSTANLDPASKAVATLSTTRGPDNSSVQVSVSGLVGTGAYQLEWSSVTGSRVNCPNGSSSCWTFANTSLGSTMNATNGALQQTITVPVTDQKNPGAGLGGWHIVQVMSGAKIEAEVPFYVQESLVAYTAASGKVSHALATAAPVPSVATPTLTQLAGVGTPTSSFHEGQEFTIAVNGVGWTQMDNTLAVDYDNGLVGYGCGFNSNGYMVIHMFATGGVGTHIIDLYPELYTLNPLFTTTAYGMTPFLDSATNYPGLAMGYQIPVIHLTIHIVK
jgi:hypothetical protein